MKLFVVLLGLLVAVSAERFTGEIDWTQVKPIEDFPHYWARFPKQAFEGFRRRPTAGSRVTNGEEATPHQFPFQVALLIDFAQGTGLCGGSVISNNYVLTAGHCVDGATSGIAILGAHNFRDNSEDNIKIKFEKEHIKRHENYIGTFIRNDLGMIRLPESIVFSDKIQPSRLPTKSQANQMFVDEIATVSGWGRYSDNAQQTSNVVRFTSNPILENSVCAKSFGSILIQTQNICMNGEAGHSACNGDSGGPLTVTIEKQKIQVGIVSFGSGAGCEKGYPSVYARTSYFLKWISDNSDVIIQE